MSKNVNLLDGSIIGSMSRLAFPIMGASLIQMGYNLVDMIWIGRLGSGAVAAVGAAGMFLWMANGVTTVPRIGGQVSVGQKLGAGQQKEAAEYASCALRMGLFLGIIYGLICALFNKPLISFFKLNSPEVIAEARWYLVIAGGLLIFFFLDQVIGGILAAMGNTVTTFRVTTVGLVINLVLDPVLIFGLGPFPRLEVIGAALATVFAQMIVFLLYLKAIWNEPVIFRNLRLLRRSNRVHLNEIVKIGLPSALQDVLFSAISMVIARFVAGYGDAAVAVQKVGGQIESISWMMGGGFAMAVNSFVAQNYGAGKIERVRKGFRTAIMIMGIWGLFNTFLLMTFPKFFFSIFISEPDVIPMGVDYLRIIGISEVFICLEGAATGAFQGLGKTVPPSIVGITFNALRIPAALLLSHTALGLNGIWWVLTVSCIFKGTILPLWYHFGFNKMVKRS
ncbi:MAG: MATE family efflux transporter [Peptococcaceae bacterium]